MAKHGFYASPSYRKRQSEHTKAIWESGRFDFLYKKEIRICRRQGCDISFEVLPSDEKRYCSSRCAALVNNKKRGRLSEETREKISKSLKGTASPWKGVIKVPRVEMTCANVACGKKFSKEPWRKKRFCSVTCAMHVTGSRPTSPKAARAKAGIRPDINDTTYFYSRWEANLARLFNYLGIVWIHQPTTFDLGGQKYTPDFYLPNDDLYIEVKNFLGPYSKERDDRFRELRPDVDLWLLLKAEYLELEATYACLIPNWEYKNSKFENPG